MITLLRLVILTEILACSAIIWAIGCVIAARAESCLKKILIYLAGITLAISPWAAGIIYFSRVSFNTESQLSTIKIFTICFCVAAAMVSLVGKSRAAYLSIPKFSRLLPLLFVIFSLNCLMCHWYLINQFKAISFKLTDDARKLFPDDIPYEENAATYYRQADELLNKYDPK